MELFASLAQAPVHFPTSGRLWWTVLLFLLWLSVVTGVVYLVVRILSAKKPGRAERREGMSALEIVRRRYARGNRDRELYQNILEDDGPDRDDDES